MASDQLLFFRSLHYVSIGGERWRGGKVRERKGREGKGREGEGKGGEGRGGEMGRKWEVLGEVKLVLREEVSGKLVRGQDGGSELGYGLKPN